jgi:signal transduction histidine kinase
MFDWTQLSELGFLIDALPFPTWVTDAQGRCRWQNGASLRNWGSLSGQTIEDMSVPEDVRERWRDGQRRALRGEVVENLIEPKSDTYGGYLGVVAPLRQGKEIIGTIGLRVDLDERFAALRQAEQLEAGLQQADRLISLGTLTASVGHEIRNPLSYLQMTLTMMRGRIDREAGQGMLDVAALQRDVKVALEGTERIVALVKDLQAFSGPSTEEPGEADLNSVVRSILALASADIRPNRVELGLGTLPPVSGSPVRLGQVVLNLLLNANRAARESAGSAPGCIWIRTRQASDAWVELVVADNGPGIPPEMRERLFMPFASGHAVSGGTGLGLYVVHQIVGALGGEIGVADRPEGGAEFAVTIPIARSE